MFKKTVRQGDSIRQLVSRKPIFSLVLLLLVLITSIIITPLSIAHKNTISTTVASLIVIMLILALGVLTEGRPKVRVFLEISGIIAFGLRVITEAEFAPYWLVYLTLTASILFNAGMMVMLIKRLFASVPQIEKLLVAINFYVLTGISFSYFYLLINLVNPSAFGLSGQTIDSWPDYLYFSFVTLTTLGYGDIVPLSSLAHSLAVLEAIIGVLSPTVMIARFVGLEE